jgi:putative MATE family efflux protein
MSDFQYKTKGIKTLLGDPKKAVFKLALPIIASNMVQTVYNLVDAIWVAGISSDALAAVGFFFPFFFIAIALGFGVGIGGGSEISRRIGAKDRSGAGDVGMHTFLLTAIIALSFSLPLFFFIKNILILIGAGSALSMAVSYARIMIIGSFFLFFANVGIAVLRSEGDTKRAMWAMVFGAVLNIGLDPIFIYVLKLGVAGAAWASFVSLGVSSAIIFYWLFLKKDTFVPLHFKGFKYKYSTVKSIFSVGIPASMQHLSMAVSMFFMNYIVVGLAGPDGIAVLMSGWRIFMFGSMPVFGISAAIVTLSGAAYGAGDLEKLDIGFMFGVKAALILELISAVILYIFAPYFIVVFTYSKGAGHIADDLLRFLRVIAFMYPAMALGPISSSMFQGVGKGVNALLITVLRSVILMIPFMLLFAYYFQLGLAGVWWGIVAANAVGASLAFIWARRHLNKIKLSSFSV